ncbi:MAG TPA: response regulator transcription factor [Actinomycetota bacterium]|nr:response regulator transcription factor [Actinomycetota bacterium]
MSTQSVRILIVDDQEPFRAAARDVVEMIDSFEVVGEAETGAGSVEAAAALRPDLILMDINLPDMDGLEATRRILEGNQNGVVVVALSTYERERYEARAVQSGAAAYIPKSEFGPDQLLAAWEAAAEGHHETSPDV